MSIVTLPPDYKPSEKEEYMNEKQLEYFRQKLLAWKSEMIKELTAGLQNIQENELNASDLNDRASSETEQGIELQSKDRARKLIKKIDIALARIENGTYGYCEETGEPIGLKRLEARPVAIYCIEAQERYERKKKQLGIVSFTE